MLVRNLNGTSDNICKCGSWLKHWKKFSKQSVSKCVVVTCSNQATYGAHVQIVNGDSNWFIIPICDNCNKLWGSTFEIYDDIKLVSANVYETCVDLKI